MSDEEIGGRYRLIEPLGRGAMSSVWLAEDPELGRLVAVKLLSPAADRARFEREARAAASLSHPNLCSLYDYGESDGKPFMVLEYLPNGSLEERLADGKPLPDAEALSIAREVAAGLAHAHERGLVHRDLKPANVLFDSEGHPKIADFGIARMGDSGTLTEAGTVLGTASYISPEQASGELAGPPSDVYSFGVILFRMLTGRLPFTGANAMEVVRMHRDDEPPAIRSLRPDAPVALERLATAALAKDPAARPADGTALLVELARGADDAMLIVAPGALPAAAETGATQVIRPSTRPRARRRIAAAPLALAAVAAVVLLAVGVGAALVTTGGGSGPGTAPLPSVSLPIVTTAPSSSSAAPTTTGETTTTAATTQASVPVSTAAPATTAVVPPVVPATTVATTTRVTTAPATTTAPPATTAEVTTDTTPTTATTAETTTAPAAPTTTTGP
jgi:eukaryotic-like serine/threonine-protein kinase